MKRLSLSSILLFCLCIYFIMQNRISWGDTPFLLFGIIFLLLVVNIVIDMLTLKEHVYNLLKNSLLIAITTLVLGAAFLSSMIVRHQTAPIYGVNDIIVQQEAAIRYFVHGKNPYKETYFGTPVADWHYSDTQVNPALYHFVMEPLYLLLPLPVYTLSNHIFGYFDAREVLWLLFAGSLVIAFLLPKEDEKKRLFVTILAWNPATLGYVLEGRSDMFVFFFLILSWYLLEKKKLFWAGIFLGLSFVVKQSSWPLFPLYFATIAKEMWDTKREVVKKIGALVIHLVVIGVVFAGFILPFFLWNGPAFIASTIGYLSGNTPHSYPISGYGFGMILNQLGVIKDVNAYYPFTLWQLAIAGPLLLFFMWILWKKYSVQKLILLYAISLFVFWYFSRYFNNSHVGFISSLLITGYFWPKENTV